MKIKREDGDLQAKERGLEGSNPSDISILDF